MMSLFVVERGTEGVAVGPPLAKPGMGASEMAEIVSRGCRLPASALLGEEERWLLVALRVLSLGRGASSAFAVGLGRAALEEATGYARHRLQFGGPLFEQQFVRFTLAEMATRLEAAWQLTLYAARRLSSPALGDRAKGGHTMIRTPLTTLLGIDHPLIQAGMGGVAGWRLAAAVSNAGGLGVLGAALMSPEAVRQEIHRIKEATDRPYGVDLLLAEGTPMIEELMAVLFEERVPVFVSGLGDPGRWVEPMHAAGMKVVALVGNVRQAQRCARSGVDVIVAQGHEAGGHTGRIPTFVLVPLVADAVAPIPVVAAGGVGDGRGLAAALMLGAQGVLVGTRFIATEEAACHDAYKAKLQEIDEEGTLVTRSYTGKPCRVIRNRHTEEWAGREAEIQKFPLQLLAVGERAGAAMTAGDLEYGLAPAGQVSGMIRDRPTAAEIVGRLIEEAEASLERAPAWCEAGGAAVDPAGGN